MNDERIKTPVLESSEPSGTPGSDTSKTGFGGEVSSDKGAKKQEEKPTGNEQGSR